MKPQSRFGAGNTSRSSRNAVEEKVASLEESVTTRTVLGHGFVLVGASERSSGCGQPRAASPSILLGLSPDGFVLYPVSDGDQLHNIGPGISR